MGRYALTFLLILSTGWTFGQGLSNDTLDTEPADRPHFIYFEAMGRTGYYGLGYGYSFYRKEKHELNFTIGYSFLKGYKRDSFNAFPVGLFYRYGQKFKFEVGFTVTPTINWYRFKAEYYYEDGFINESVYPHQLIATPSLGFVYGTPNKKFELGARYTPLINTLKLENSISYMFGAFFHIRLK